MIKRIAIAVAALVLVSSCTSTGSQRLRFVSGEGPHYPEDAQANHVEGYVVVTYDVDVDGKVVNARVVDAAPPGVFDQAALDAIERWHFYPPVVDGKPEAVHDRSSKFEFKLGNADQYER